MSEATQVNNEYIIFFFGRSFLNLVSVALFLSPDSDQGKLPKRCQQWMTEKTEIIERKKEIEKKKKKKKKKTKTTRQMNLFSLLRRSLRI